MTCLCQWMIEWTNGRPHYLLINNILILICSSASFSPIMLPTHDIPIHVKGISKIVPYENWLKSLLRTSRMYETEHFCFVKSISVRCSRTSGLFIVYPPDALCLIDHVGEFPRPIFTLPIRYTRIRTYTARTADNSIIYAPFDSWFSTGKRFSGHDIGGSIAVTAHLTSQLITHIIRHWLMTGHCSN